MPSDLRADDLQQSVYDQFMTFVPILLQRENRFPTAANTIVLLKSEGPEDDAALAGMVEAQFETLFQEFSSGFMGRMTHGTHILETGTRWAGMAKGAYDAGRAIYADGATIAPLAAALL
jgi:hypothetical protein